MITILIIECLVREMQNRVYLRLMTQQHAVSPVPESPFPHKQAKVHLPFLDGLRGVCALYVVLHHFLSWGSVGISSLWHYLVKWTEFGHFAVTIFIVLSGFSLMLQVVSSPERKLRGGTLDYIQRRARRIVPPYIAALFFSVLILLLIRWVSPSPEPRFGSDLSASSLLSHLFLVHNLSSRWVMSINMAHWTIATEWQIYFLFPLILLPIWRRWPALCIPSGIVIGLLPHFALPKESNLDWACPWFVALFTMGMATAAYHGRTASDLNRRRPWLVGIVSFTLLYLIFKVVLRGEEFAWTRDICAGALVACFIAWCCDAVKRKNMPKPLVVRLLESRVAVGLGAFSYSLYLTHCAILNVLYEVARRFHFSADAALAMRAFIGVPVALGLAYLFFCYFERPFLAKKTVPPVTR